MREDESEAKAIKKQQSLILTKIKKMLGHFHGVDHVYVFVYVRYGNRVALSGVEV